MASCGTTSLIDLVLMSNPSSMQHCSVIPPLSNSDHNGVELSIKWKSGNPKLCPQTIWKYSLADFSRANDEIECVDWDTLLHDRNLPKRRKLPWVNAGIRHAIRKRNYLYRKSKCNPDFRAKYKQQRNKVVSQLRSAKRPFVDTIPTGNTKEFWKVIKLLNGKGSQTIPVINHDGRQLVSDQQKADALNYFFHSCFNTTLPPLSEEGNSLVLDPAACPEELYCSEQEVYELLTNLDHKKASGPDGISGRMLKGTATSVAPVLTMLFNRSIQTGKLPSAW